MRRFSQRRGLQTLAEINVTPLLDLCFVLLVIFMITTPLLESSLDLAVPTTAAAGAPVEGENVNVLSIDRRAAIQLDGEPVAPEALDERLRELKGRKGEGLSVVVRAHKELPVQRFVTLMDALGRAGIARVGVVTQAEDSSDALPAP